MSTLAEIEAAADTLTEGEKEDLLRYLAMSLRKQRARPEPRANSHEETADMLDEDEAEDEGKPRKGLTPEEFEAWWKKAAGIGVSGMTTDEHMAMTRGDE